MLVRHWFYALSCALLLAWFHLHAFPPLARALIYVASPFVLLGVFDVLQRKHNVLRNYPVVAHLRYFLESFRPQIRQYFIEDNITETPFSREQRELVKHRAQLTLDAIPFGTQRGVYEPGYQWIEHSLSPCPPSPPETHRVRVGNAACGQPYLASRLNVSAMSYGALSQHAVRALSRGARLGGFALNTGEGGMTPYHLQEGGDLVLQIGTGYFGFRTPEGGFSPELFAEKAVLDAVKMIEIKLSQGAKPAHGGLLPGSKVSEELANIRGIPEGEDCLSPASHAAFKGPKGLCDFIALLRKLSGGKPIGFKLCIGRRKEFLSVCKAMMKTGIFPDFITIDGSEGGTGAAPVEFTDSIGTPLNEALHFVHQSLLGIQARDKITLVASGKIVSGFDMACKMALGADVCNAARPMLFALGCLQSRACHTNLCPTGIATQDKRRMFALDVNEKAPRVANYHRETLKSFSEVLGAAGLKHPNELRKSQFGQRTQQGHVASFEALYPHLELGALLSENAPEPWNTWWKEASADWF